MSIPPRPYYTPTKITSIKVRVGGILWRCIYAGTDHAAYNHQFPPAVKRHAPSPLQPAEVAAGAIRDRRERPFIFCSKKTQRGKVAL